MRNPLLNSMDFIERELLSSPFYYHAVNPPLRVEYRLVRKSTRSAFLLLIAPVRSVILVLINRPMRQPQTY
jgi:hypothetical protein